MKELNRSNFQAVDRPVKIMQFGEGNFLRAFVDWILQNLNDAGCSRTADADGKSCRP